MLCHPLQLRAERAVKKRLGLTRRVVRRVRILGTAPEPDRNLAAFIRGGRSQVEGGAVLLVIDRKDHFLDLTCRWLVIGASKQEGHRSLKTRCARPCGVAT